MLKWQVLLTADDILCVELGVTPLTTCDSASLCTLLGRLRTNRCIGSHNAKSELHPTAADSSTLIQHSTDNFTPVPQSSLLVAGVRRRVEDKLLKTSSCTLYIYIDQSFHPTVGVGQSTTKQNRQKTGTLLAAVMCSINLIGNNSHRTLLPEL